MAARPERVRDLRAAVVDAPAVSGTLSIDRAITGPVRAPSTIISRGLGRSYGDASLNEGVILHERLNRLLSFDPASGVLECEAGVSFAEVIGAFVQRGYFPPVTPGTKFVTLGGAIAADVHGKNHHVDGSIANFVEELTLVTADGAELVCSRAQNAEVFWATVGGMGLTGAILSLKLRLKAVPSAFVNVDYRRAANLDAALELFEGEHSRRTYSVAWIDCLSSGASLGRSVLMSGEHAAVEDLPAGLRDRALAPPARRAKSVPFFFPGFALNSLSCRAFNAVYYGAHKDGRKVVDFDSFFYPLDHVHHWNRVYGRRGFQQYQFVIPPEAGRAGLLEIMERLTESRRASFLAVLKTFGAESGGLLSFPRPGWTLALDLPNAPGLSPFLQEMDKVVLRHGGRRYLAKDACLLREDFEAMYPRLGEFKAVRARMDPGGRLSSALARRLGLA